MTLTVLFNMEKDRRQQSLPFIGRERRKLELAQERREKINKQNASFLEKIQHIEGVKKIA